MQTKEKKFATLPTVEKVKTIIGWLEEKKARDIVAYDLAGQSPFAEALIIVSAGSVRHGQSLADHVLAMCNENSYEFLRMEGYPAGQWILVDLNDIIVNVFQPDTRGMFRLESLWAKSPMLHDGRSETPGGDEDL